MKFAEIKELLDKGFTPDQIMTLANEPAVPEAPEAPEKDKAPEPKAEPANVSDERLSSLEKAVTELTKTIQANAIINDLQPGQSVKTDMEILASVINPGGK